MRKIAIIGLAIASSCFAQDSISTLPQQSATAQSSVPASAQPATILIPANTHIPLVLSSPITTKSGRPGAAIRALTTFPITVGTQLAIPTGTYIEGVIDKVTRGGRNGLTLRAHFTRMLFANGYSVTIDGADLQAMAAKSHSLNAFLQGTPSTAPKPGFDADPRFEAALFTSADQSHYVLAAQTIPEPPTLPPPPSMHTGRIIGIAVGSAVAFIVAAIVLAHHNRGGSEVLFDTGWQLEMVLHSPLSVDAASIGTASAPAAE